MKNAPEKRRTAGKDSGASSMTAVCLLLAVTVVAAAILGGALLGKNSVVEDIPRNGESVLLRIDTISGGLSSGKNPVRFQDNEIRIKHCGGDPVPLENVSVVLTGEGNAYHGIPGTPDGRLLTGRLTVRYMRLDAAGKNDSYAERNRGTLADGFFSPGEVLVFRGNDSASGNNETSVIVETEHETETSDNFGLKAGTFCRYEIYLEENGKKTPISKGECLVSGRPKTN